MSKFLKIIAVISVIAMLVSATVSCKDNAQGQPQSDTTVSADLSTSTSGDTAPSYTEPEVTDPEELFDTPESFKIEKSGYALNVELVRSQDSLSGALDIKKAQYLSMLISDKIGTGPQLNTDWAKVEDSSKFEIIVGATDHPETDALLKTLSYGDWAVRAVGNKIIIMAFSEDGYNAAVSHMATVINNGLDKSTKTITLKTADLDKTESCKDQLSALPTYDGGRFYAAYDAGRVTATTDCDQIIVKNTNLEEYGVYLTKLAANGYTKYSSNSIAGNEFAIYTNGSYTVNVGFYANNNEARLLIEPQGALPARAEDNKTEKVTTSEIMLLGLTKSAETMNGKCLIVRLEDGRFIVVDGGFNSDEHFNNFKKTIKDSAKAYTDKPVIAAWIVTHSHGDHTGLLNGKYAKIKAEGIGIESFIYNEISEYERMRSVAYSLTITNKGTYDFPDTDNGYSTRAVLDKYPSEFGADNYKPHIGQTFYISNLKMEVLYSLEGYAPKICNTMNTASVVIKMTFTDTATGKETSLLSTGDATGFSMGVADNIFGSYLKSDIITVNHHGYTSWGGDAQIIAAYKKVDATLLLWPLGDGHYKDLSIKTYNAPLFKNPSYKESYNSGDIGTVVRVPLPYVVGNVTKSK